MPIQFDTAQEKLERDFQIQSLVASERQAEHQRKHEQEMLRLKVELTTKQKRGVAHTDALLRLCLALVKLPTLPVVWLGIFILIVAHRGVPEFVSQYVNL